MIHNIVFKVTHACNLACRYCYAWGKKSKIALPSILKATIKSAVHLDADTVHFIWHGGEPLLAGVDFFSEACILQQQIAEGSGKRFINSLQTNGILIQSDFIDLFKHNEFNVGVSLDGPPQLHNKNRFSSKGEGSYCQSLRGYQALTRAGVRTGIISVVDPEFPPDEEIILDWLQEIKAPSISFSPMFAKRVVYTGRYLSFLSSLRQAIICRNLKIPIRELILLDTDPEILKKRGLLDACHPGWPCYETISTVDEQGYIYFGCDRFISIPTGKKKKYILGHVENGGFKKALSSTKFLLLATLSERQKQKCTSTSDISAICPGECTADWML